MNYTFLILSVSLPNEIWELVGVADTLTDFANDPTGFIIEIVEEYLISGILAGWRWFLANVVGKFFEAIEMGIVDGIAIPLRDALTLGGTSVYDALVSMRTWAESGLMELGVAAPFAIVVSWLLMVVFVAVIFQLLWGLAETYLPVDSVSGAVDAVRTALAGESS